MFVFCVRKNIKLHLIYHEDGNENDSENEIENENEKKIENDNEKEIVREEKNENCIR